MKELEELRETIRNPYAWPGGYAKVGLMSDGESLCVDCLKSEYREIYRATRDADSSGWAFSSPFIHWEGAPDICAHCGNEIPSEYGRYEPEPEDYILSDSGPLGSRTSLSIHEGKFIGEFADEDEAIEEIRSRMESENFRPDVWRLSDHGNWSGPLSLELEGAES